MLQLTKAKSLLAILALATSASAILTGCNDEIPITRAEQYEREFIKNFGSIDPNHDWNTATRATVTVNSPVATDVKIYATVQGTRYLFGTFEGVEGTRELSVDIPKGVSKVEVRANGKTYPVTPGASVTLAARTSRADGEVKVTASMLERSRWKQFTNQEIVAFKEVLEEGCLNVDRVTDNFRFTADKDFIIYPVYWNTGNSPVVGIYYRPNGTTNPAEFKKYPLFDQKNDVIDGHEVIPANQILQCCANSNQGWVMLTEDDVDSEKYPDLTDQSIYSGAKWQQFITDYYAYNNIDHDYHIAPQGMYYAPGQWNINMFGVWDNTVGGCPSITEGLYGKYTGYNSGTIANDQLYNKYPLVYRLDWKKSSNLTDFRTSYDESIESYRSKGIRVNIGNADVQFGFYIDVTGASFYSETEFNESPTTSNLWADCVEKPENWEEIQQAFIDKYVTPGLPAPHFGLYETTYIDADGKEAKRMVLGGEDWYKDGDFDLNDNIFFIEAVEPTDWPPFETEELDEVPYEWVVACEDLGNCEDFDFNDVVFGVGNFKLSADGESATVDVRALAAGGTLPVYLYHNNEQIGGEFHSWFGVSDYRQPVNVEATANKTGKTVKVKVKKDFSMSCCQSPAGDPLNMGNFTVKVEIDGTKSVTINAPNLDATANSAPQMICVPTTWLWPRESQHIYDGGEGPYPKFNEWVGNANCTDWHEASNAHANYKSMVTSRRLPANTTKPADGSWGTVTPGNSGNQGSGDDDNNNDNPPSTPTWTATTPEGFTVLSGSPSPESEGFYGVVNTTYTLPSDMTINDNSQILFNVQANQDCKYELCFRYPYKATSKAMTNTDTELTSEEQRSILLEDRSFTVSFYNAYYPYSDINSSTFQCQVAIKVVTPTEE